MEITKQQIADGYDAITDKIGLDSDFYDRSIAIAHAKGRILDIGCGRGILMQKLKRKNSQITLTGIDISPKLCEITRQNNPSARVVVGDAEALPFNDDEFDFVFMTEALEHMLDYDKAVAEITRVLKKGGGCVITVPNRDWASYDFYDRIRNKSLQPIDDHYFRFDEVEALLDRHSLRIMRVRGSDNLFYYGKLHYVERFVAFFLPFLHKRMKRLILLCMNEK